MLQLRKAIIHFILAYVVVTVLCYGLSYIVAVVFKLPSCEELGVSMFEDPAFKISVPYHLLINLLVWTAFCWLYFRKKENHEGLLKETALLGFFWLVLAMMVDLIGFVLIKSPFSLTPHQFYIEYQPWISMTYLIVLVSPLVYYGLFRLKYRHAS